MKYDFFSNKSDLHFGINNSKEFEEFWRLVTCSIDDKNVKKTLSKLKHSNVVHLDGYTTKKMCEEMEKDQNGIDFFCYTHALLNNEDFKDLECTYDQRSFVISVMLYFVIFQKFIKNTRSGFVIYRREK